MGHHTYMREAMPNGMRATCPLCCRAIQVVSDGTMVRHGWKETGRKVGEIGLGFQWGECPATRTRPLEQTDEDALVHLERIRDAIKAWDKVVAMHVVGNDYYDQGISTQLNLGYSDTTFEAWAKSGLEVVGDITETKKETWGRERQVRTVTYRVPRGYAGARYVYSYEKLRADEQTTAEFNASQLREAERMLIEAIKHHSKTEPVRAAEKRERTVHARWPRTGRPVCGSRGYSAVTTDDNTKVTCSRCRKGLEGTVST